MTRPSGTVTFLFTDIERSTEAWSSHHQVMEIARQRHDTIVRDIIEREAGYIFSTGGDGVAAAFQSARSAVTAAIDVQRALATEPWPEPLAIRIRMGINTGEAIERGGDYFGPAVIKAARLMSLVGGGRIVCSSATADMLRVHLADGVRLLRIGTSSLKGLGQDETVFVVAAPGLDERGEPLNSGGIRFDPPGGPPTDGVAGPRRAARSDGSAAGGVQLSDIGDLVIDAITSGASPVVVVASASCGDLVAERVRRSATGRDISIASVRATRSDRAAPASVMQRLGPASAGTSMIVDGQWADETTLEHAADAGHASPRPVVIIHRTGRLSRPLARVHATARRRGAVFRIAPQPRGPADPTGGQPDLLEALDFDGSLLPEITTRMSVLDNTTRFAAELLAFGPDADQIGELIDLSTEQHDTVIDELEIEGLLHDGTMIPGVAEAICTTCPPGRRTSVVATIVERGRPGIAIELSRLLTRLGDRSPIAGQLHAGVATSMAPADPAASLALVDEARACGHDDPALRRCEAVASLAMGDPRRALAALGDATSPADELVRAAAWAALGDHGAAHTCLLRSTEPSLAMWSAVATGTMTTAVTDAIEAGGPESSTRMLAEAIAAWTNGDRSTWSDRIKRATIRARSDAESDMWPITPDLIAAVVAGRRGHLAEATELTTAALNDNVGGFPHRRMHQLVGAWLAARRGHLDDAAATLALLDAAPLTPHERLWRAGIRCAIALRDAEVSGVDAAAGAMQDALAGVDIQLFDLEPLSDGAALLTRAGARNPDEPMNALAAIIERLGATRELGFELAWARLSIALAADDLERLAAAAAAVIACPDAPGAPPARRLAADTIVAITEGGADASMVEHAARQLAEAGSPHEAARLCGLAALRMTEEGGTRRLLKESRSLRAQRTQLKQSPRVDRSVTRLSEQEVNVGRMVLEGQTHKAIGASLFISAKTVEHHVAHIRTKLGATSRAELIASLRDYLAET